MASLWMFPALILGILTGFPVAFTMLVLALLFGWATFGEALQYQLIQKIDDTASANVLAAVPLFIFMGAMFEQSGIAARLFDAIHLWTRRIPGGIGIAAVLMCVVFAATSGVIGATETVVGLLAIPAMLKYAYDKGLICGTICAGGSLGTIIPPSVLAVVIGPVANTSVGDVLIGMIVPGLMLAVSYIAYILLRCLIRPQDGPRLAAAADEPGLAARVILTVQVLVPPVVIIIAVLGSILVGLATPTEAAAMGAVGTLLLALAYRRLSLPVLWDSLERTVRVSAMILTILLAGSAFAAVFVGSGGLSAINSLLEAARLGPHATLALILLLAFLGGFMLDPLVIILIIVPIAAPIIKALGFDAVWFCVIFLVVLQTAYLTPPMAPSIFYLRGIAPREIELRHMYTGIWPFIVLQVVVTAVVMLFPQTVLWLPAAMR
ncbi:MAG: TRAP transporter large permease subunit [Alphaproteobacteria bacterium]|nr:TRAP transporter large permease subunit [Alphaproteobacteria bacterium]